MQWLRQRVMRHTFEPVASVLTLSLSPNLLNTCAALDLDAAAVQRHGGGQSHKLSPLRCSASRFLQVTDDHERGSFIFFDYENGCVAFVISAAAVSTPPLLMLFGGGGG